MEKRIVHKKDTSYQIASYPVPNSPLENCLDVWTNTALLSLDNKALKSISLHTITPFLIKNAISKVKGTDMA